ncbi:MAG: Stp1/IreP family PP2C-type Ser/Thr phosphatase [Thermoanaerobaculia bacterium]
MSRLPIVASACARSDVGKSRSTNEDYFALRPEWGLYLVADGMGGHGNGEVASRLATLSVCESLEALPQRSRSSKSRDQPPADELRNALERANQAVFEAVEENEELSGMGATMVAMVFAGTTAAVAHVGDSRAYRLRGGALERLTNDHTWVEQQVSAGELSENEARNHPFRNVVTRALGGEARLVVDLASHDVRTGDLFLLCTDGLTAVLDDDDILGHLGESADLDSRCAALIAAANKGGGPDNVTVALISFSDADATF